MGACAAENDTAVDALGHSRVVPGTPDTTNRFGHDDAGSRDVTLSEEHFPVVHYMPLRSIPPLCT